MRSCLWIVGLFGLAVAVRADTDFVKTLPPADFSGAGLQKLTPDELARLEQLIQAYKSGEVAHVQEQADARVTAVQQEAQRKVAEAESKAVDQKAAGGSAKKKPGWFMALLTLNRASEKPENEDPLESRLAGNFSGWSGHTVFTLEDGTQWVQQNKTESYVYSPVLHSPKVKISPAAITGFWLEIGGVNRNVRVIPLQLTERKPEAKQ